MMFSAVNSFNEKVCGRSHYLQALMELIVLSLFSSMREYSDIVKVLNPFNFFLR